MDASTHRGTDGHAIRRCASASSASGGSGACTPSCSPAGSPARRVAAIYDACAETARGRRRRLGVPVAGPVDEMLAAPDVDAVAICTSTDTHAELIVEAARAGKAIFCEKPVSLDLATVDRALAAVEAAGVPFQIGFNRRFDPAHASVARRGRDGAGRRAASRADHEPRPRPAAAGVRPRLGRDLPRHDDPRLRHGPLRHRLARSSRSTRAARSASTPRSARPATSTPRSCCSTHAERLPDGDRQLAPRGLRLRPARRGVRVGRHGREREPARAHRRAARRPTARATAPLPYFYLERYTQSYVREWEAFVAARRRRRDAAGHDGRRPCAARHRPRRVAVAARGPRPVRIEEVRRDATDLFADQRLDGRSSSSPAARRAWAPRSPARRAARRRRHRRRGRDAARGRPSREELAAARRRGALRRRPTSPASRCARDRRRLRRALRAPRRPRQRRRAEQPRHPRRHERRAVGPAVRRQRARAVPADAGGRAAHARDGRGGSVVNVITMASHGGEPVSSPTRPRRARSPR